MGGILDTILGGSKQKSESSSSSDSSNRAYDWLKSTYGPQGGQAFQGGTNMLGNILGLGTDPNAGSAALNNYWNSAGGQFQLGEGLDALTSKYSALGLSKSGAAMKGMEKYRQGLASTYLNNYLGQLNDYSKLGLGAGSLIGSAGGISHSESESTGTGSSSNGIGDILGSIIGAVAMSDIRLKDDIELVGELGGLKLYDFTYLPGFGLPEGRFRGVMAQDVAKVRPDALGPEIHGYLTISDPTLFPQRIAA